MYWILGRYAIVGFLGLGLGWVINGWRLEASINAYKLKIAAEEAKLIQEYRRKEQAFQVKADALRREKDNEIKTITTRLNSTLSELRQRQDRPVPGSAGTCQGASGAELSRQDGEFLAREAARADRLRSALEQCYKQYDSIRN